MKEGETTRLQFATTEIKSVHNTSVPCETSTDERKGVLQKQNLSTKSVIHPCTYKDTSSHVMDSKTKYDFRNTSKSGSNYLNNCTTCQSHNYYK